MMALFLEVCGVLFTLVVMVQSNVVVRTSNTSQDVTFFEDALAAFGPSIPNHGIVGYVYNVNPFNACRPVDPPPDNTSVWIALIARDNCTFVEKIRNVQRWAVAAIVYNHKDNNNRERMHGDGSGINIPSVFVGWSDGEVLGRNYCYNCTTLEATKGAYVIEISDDPFRFNPAVFVLFAAIVGLCLTIMIVSLVSIDDREPFETPYILWPFAVVVGTCMVLMLIFMVVKWCRDLRKKQRSRLSIKHLKKIPVKKFKKGEEYDVCAICLDDYEEGDKLRLLPCSHVYHTKCVDPWLTKNKRSCPICKRKVIPGDDPDSDSESSDGEDEPSERTPLLVASSSGTVPSRSTFDNSGLPESVRQAHLSHVNEGSNNTATEDSDQSDSEIGAVGGARPVNMAMDNPLLSLPRGSPIEGGAIKHLTNQNEKLESATRNIEETAVIEASHEEDNSGFYSDEEDCVPDSDVVFSVPSKKDDKKSNGVV